MSHNTVYYLKYRPQSLDELIGQESIKKTLLASFQNNKLAHAYLFVGPRGTGKTSTARILAKMVNCESIESSDYPCNKCSTCVSITDGSNLDLIEIDAASNRGIEDIRSLRDKIKLSPSSARKKVYIIDEVHMLTTEAFNALLKTLEEPPQHALFILATTESGKIPQTILSRVQRLDFKLATQIELLETLRRIVKEEKIDIEEEALKILAKKSDGSFRDAVKLLDQVASIGGKITEKSIAENLKSSQFDNILKLIQALAKKNAQDGLLIIFKQIEGGVDAKELLLSLMDTFRSLLLIKNGVGEQLVKAHLTEDKYNELVQIANNLSQSDLVKDLDILQSSLEKLKFASILSLPLELAIVEICGEQSSAVSRSPREATPKAGEAGQSRPDRIVDEDPRKSGSSEKEEPERKKLDVSSEEPDSNLQHQTSDTDILKLKEKWTFVLETIRPINFSLEALLRSVNIRDCSVNTLTMEVPYAFHQRILEAPKNRELLEGVFSDVLGRKLRISVSLGNRPSRPQEIANIEVAQDDEIIRVAAEIFDSDSVN